MRTDKKRFATIATATAGAAALAVAGFAFPANAAERGGDSTWKTTEITTALDAFQSALDNFSLANGPIGNDADTNAGNVGIDGGLINGPLVSDVANGPILSGNDAPVLSGNDVSAPVGSGNDVAVDAPVGSGNEVGTGNVVGSGNDTGVSIGDIGADVDNLVGDISSDVDGLISGLLD